MPGAVYNFQFVYSLMSDHMPLVDRSLIHDSDAKGEGKNALCRAWRLSSLFRTKLIPLAAAALLIALIVTRNEVSLVLRNGSDPARTSTIVTTSESSVNGTVVNVDDKQQAQTNNNSAAAVALTTTKNLEDRDRKQQNQELPVNWTLLHLAENEQAQPDLDVLRYKLQDRFTRLKNDDEILTYEQLAQQFRPLLQERGLLMVGDSTARLLFVALWCVVDGFFPSDGIHSDSVCIQRQKELKEKCHTMMENGEQCAPRAAFSNETTNLYLEFQSTWRIKKLEDYVVKAMGNSSDRFIFCNLPCLHALWIPGGFEAPSIDAEYPQWSTHLHNFFTSIEESNPSYSFLLGTPVTVCDSKLWQKPLVEMYLQDENFVNGSPHDRFSLMRQKPTLPANYSGPVPVAKSGRKNHNCDNALFDEGGALRCTSVGLEVLSQHSLLNNPTVTIVDMHDATENGCDDANDGVHYIRGLTLQRQLTLLLKAMQTSATKR